MHRYQRVMVAVNLSKLDATVVRYADMICRLAQSKRVYFTHVAPELEVPAALRERYPTASETAEDAIERTVRELVGEHFTGSPGVEVRVEVALGSPVVELLRGIRQHEIDIAVVGKGAGKDDAGSVPEQLARQAPCSVMIVHEGSEPRISRILVPVDFSDHSTDAFEAALAFARARGPAAIHCLHVYDVQPFGKDIARTYEQFAEIVRDHVEEAYRAFVNGFDLGGVSVTPDFVADGRPSKAIVSAIERHRPDLVVMGARGRTAAAAVLLGSTTERVIRRAGVSLLAVKRKGAGMGWLEALLGG
jgi:nucleotide-binding universal stress UspA family protein